MAVETDNGQTRRLVDSLIAGYLSRCNYVNAFKDLTNESPALRAAIATAGMPVFFDDTLHGKHLDEIIILFNECGDFGISSELLDFGLKLQSLVNEYATLTRMGARCSNTQRILYGRQGRRSDQQERENNRIVNAENICPLQLTGTDASNIASSSHQGGSDSASSRRKCTQPVSTTRSLAKGIAETYQHVVDAKTGPEPSSSQSQVSMITIDEDALTELMTTLERDFPSATGFLDAIHIDEDVSNSEEKDQRGEQHLDKALDQCILESNNLADIPQYAEPVEERIVNPLCHSTPSKGKALDRVSFSCLRTQDSSQPTTANAPRKKGAGRHSKPYYERTVPYKYRKNRAIKPQSQLFLERVELDSDEKCGLQPMSDGSSTDSECLESSDEKAPSIPKLTDESREEGEISSSRSDSNTQIMTAAEVDNDHGGGNEILRGKENVGDGETQTAYKGGRDRPEGGRGSSNKGDGCTHVIIQEGRILERRMSGSDMKIRRGSYSGKKVTEGMTVDEASEEERKRLEKERIRKEGEERKRREEEEFEKWKRDFDKQREEQQRRREEERRKKKEVEEAVRRKEEEERRVAAEKEREEQEKKIRQQKEDDRRKKEEEERNRKIKEEEERIKKSKEEQERLKREEERVRKLKEEEERRRKEEQERARQRLEQERLRRIEEERLKKEQEEKRRREEEERRKQEEIRLKREEEKRRKEEEERLKREEEERRRREEEERIRREKEEQLKREREEQLKREEEERLKKEEEERLRREEEERLKQEEEERRRREEEERRAREEEEERRRKQEEERLRKQEEERLLREEEERLQREEEERRQREEQEYLEWKKEEQRRLKEEFERRRLEEEERRRIEEEERRKKEEEERRRRQQEEEEMVKLSEEELRRRWLEEKRRKEEISGSKVKDRMKQRSEDGKKLRDEKEYRKDKKRRKEDEEKDRKAKEAEERDRKRKDREAKIQKEREEVERQRKELEEKEMKRATERERRRKEEEQREAKEKEERERRRKEKEEREKAKRMKEKLEKERRRELELSTREKDIAEPGTSIRTEEEIAMEAELFGDDTDIVEKKSKPKERAQSDSRKSAWKSVSALDRDSYSDRQKIPKTERSKLGDKFDQKSDKRSLKTSKNTSANSGHGLIDDIFDNMSIPIYSAKKEDSPEELATPRRVTDTSRRMVSHERDEQPKKTVVSGVQCARENLLVGGGHSARVGMVLEKATRLRTKYEHDQRRAASLRSGPFPEPSSSKKRILELPMPKVPVDLVGEILAPKETHIDRLQRYAPVKPSITSSSSSTSSLRNESSLPSSACASPRVGPDVPSTSVTASPRVYSSPDINSQLEDSLPSLSASAKRARLDPGTINQLLSSLNYINGVSKSDQS